MGEHAAAGPPRAAAPNTGGQIAAALGGPLYGAFLDRGLGFGAVWGAAAMLGLLRVLAVLGLREAPRPQ